MSGDLITNRSFLHRNLQPASKAPDKVVYATLDCLALKRATLPLQLVPVDSVVSPKTDKIDGDHKRNANNPRKVSCRRPSFKIRPGAGLHWKQRHKVNLVTGKFENTQKESVGRQSWQAKNGNLTKVPYRNATKTVPEVLDSQVPAPSQEQSNSSKQEKPPSHRKKRKTDSRVRSTESGCPDHEPEPRSSRKLRDDDQSASNIYSEIIINQTQSANSDSIKTETGYAAIQSSGNNAFNSSKSGNGTEKSLELLKETRTVSEGIAHFERRRNLMSSKLKSLSRNELRNVKISNPKDFVHVASATTSKLIDSSTTKLQCEIPSRSFQTSSAKEREDRMAKNLTNDGNQNEETKVVAEGVPVSPITSSSSSSSSLWVSPITVQSNVKAKTEFFDRIKRDVGAGRREPLRRLCTYEDAAGGRGSKCEKVPTRTPENLSMVKTDENEAEEKIYETMSDVLQKPKPNSSFLWSDQQIKMSKSLVNLWRSSNDDQPLSSVFEKPSSPEIRATDVDDDDYETYEEYDEYDHVGPPTESYEADDYDDVGSACPNGSIEDLSDDNVYDVVVPLKCTSSDTSSSSQSRSQVDFQFPTKTSNVPSLISDSTLVLTRNQLPREIDVGILRLSEESEYLSANEYSTLEELSVDGVVYDDVGLPSQDRVNSLYAGSVSGFNGREESEWEDLDETPPPRSLPPPPPPLPLPQRNGNSTKVGGDVQLTPCKKKLGLTWSHKVRRQRSKASRENSARSSNQNTRDHTSADSSSDNSNYETLYSSQLDDFSSDSETEKDNAAGDGVVSPGKPCVYSEAPSRPTPLPPREASLTQTLGRRMKQLRRTWSLTKGSLGRIGKRHSGEQNTIYNDQVIVKDPNIGNPVGANTADYKKYFSFKKHFRKSMTGLSTFYLDKNENNFSPTYNDNKEKIYSNINWSGSESRGWEDDDSIQSQNSNADRCSLLAEEPLYQFYAAAAARVAFESDSDGYEEVEDLMPSKAATDLAKPGHRTLWCQTPQVLNNNLHQRLSAEERKLQEAKFEIITSEASYLSSLRVLEEEFVKNFESNSGIVTISEKEKLFAGVPGIRKASERFLADLEHIWTEDPMMYGLPDVLLKHAKRSCNVYVRYCSNQVSIDTTLKELRGRKGSKFVENLTRIETHPACQNLSLHSFLMLPMQRVTRLPLLADAVLTKLSSDHLERTPWENALSTLSRVVADCNEGARAAGRQIEMEALARKLEYSSKLTAITLRDKHLIRSGPVIQLSPKTDADYKLTFGKRLTKTSLYLFLLTDHLLVTKPKLSSHDETYLVIDTCKRNLITMQSVDEDSPWAGRHAMILTLLENHVGREVEFVLTCDSDTELMRWLDVISPPKPSLIGETLYESWDCPQVMALYSYAPGQPDELALHPGDVINVLRKMADGWNHGEKLLDGEQGWFPANYTKEVASEHVRARNLKQRHRLLAVTGNLLQKRGKSNVMY